MENHRIRNELHPDGMIALVGAITREAVKDYRRALILGHHGMQEECEKFFHSRYFESISNLNGQAIIEKVQKDVAIEMKTRKKHFNK